MFTTLVDQSLVAVAVPHIQVHLDASVNQIVWVQAIYLLTFAAPLLVTGRLGDRFGQRNVYLVGMAIFIAAALACSLVPSIEWLIVMRAVQGLGASLLNPQPLSIINRVFPKHRRGAAMGVWSAVAGSSGLVGPVIGGLIVGSLGWRPVFLLYVPLGLVSLLLVALWVPKLPKGARRIDMLSVLVSLVAVFGVVFTVQQGPELGWPPWLWGVLAVGLMALAVFLWLQRTATRRGTEALVPFELFRHRNFAHGVISVATLGFTVYALNLPIMLYLQTGKGLDSEIAGLMLVPSSIISILAAPVVGRLADKLRPGVISRFGFGSMIAALALFSLLMRESISPWWLILPMLLLGAANAMCWSSNVTISMRQLPPHLVGAGSGVYNTSRQVGAAIGMAALGAVMQVGVASTDFSSAMGNTMLLPIAVLVIGFIAVSRFRPDL